MLKVAGGALLLILFFMGGGAAFNHYFTKDLETEKELIAKTSEIQALQLDLQKERSKNELLESANADYAAQIDRLNGLVKEKDSTIGSTQKAINNLQGRVNVLQDSIFRLLEVSSSCNATNVLLEQDFTIAMINLDEKIEELDTLQAEKKALESRIYQLEKASNQSEKEQPSTQYVSSQHEVGAIPVSPPNFFVLAIMLAGFIVASWGWIKKNVLFYKGPVE